MFRLLIWCKVVKGAKRSSAPFPPFRRWLVLSGSWGPSEVSKVRIVLLRHLTTIGLARPVVLGVDVEALRVTWVSYWGLDGALMAAVVHVVPVDLAEEGVRLDAGCTAADVSKALRTIDGAERAYYILGIF